MKKLILAAMLLLTSQAHAVGIGGGIIAGHPEYDYAWFTLDQDYNFSHPPFAKFVSGTLTLQAGADNLPYPGIQSPYVTYNSSTIACNGANGATLKRSDTGNNMMWCDGTGWLDVTTLLGNVTTSASTINTSLVSLTGTVATLSSTVGTKQNSLGTSNTTAFLSGDLTWRRPTVAKTFNIQSRSLNTCFQISATQDTFASYSVDIATTLSLSGGTVGTVYLEYSDNSSCSTNTQEVGRFVNGNTGTLTIGLNLSQNATGTLTGMIPAGKYVNIRTQNNTGTPTFTYRSGQEVMF